MVNEHFAEIEAEYCLAEGGGVTRIGGEVKYATVADAREDPARHRARRRTASPATDRCRSSRTRSCTSPARSARSASGGPTIRFNETTGTYFRNLAAISPPEVAKYYRDVLSTDPKVRAGRRDDWLLENEPRHSSMLRTSVSPNIFTGGYRSNVIPSEAKATLDVRALPDEDPAKFLEQVKQGGQRPGGRRRVHRANSRPAAGARRAARLRAVQGARGGGTKHLQRVDAADDEHRRDRHGAAAREGRAVLRHRPGDRLRGRRRRASARTAIRSGCSRASCTASCASYDGWSNRPRAVSERDSRSGSDQGRP